MSDCAKDQTSVQGRRNAFTKHNSLFEFGFDLKQNLITNVKGVIFQIFSKSPDSPGVDENFS